ncbi:MAG: zf-HC2 domain-containing protein [Chloroflexi bacterium]|nr:zf-HC2 domain-containing protein [Chloroflexota bacterium]
MKLFRNRHSAYEEMVSGHLDGQLDAAGDASLKKHLTTCEACSNDIREQGAVRDLLRAQPLANVPRSFALPYAPVQVVEPGLSARASSLLRGMQIATAAAAVVLVALIGVSIVDPGAPATPQSLATALESDMGQTGSTTAPESSLGKSTEPTPSLAIEFMAADGPESAPEIAPPADDALVPDATPAPAVSQDLPVDSGGGIGPLVSALPADGAAPEVVNAPATIEARSALEWAQLVSGIVTALLAIAVVGLTWSNARRPI